MEEKPKYAVGLDAGSLRTRFTIGVLERSGLRLIGFGESASEGWVKGRIADQHAASFVPVQGGARIRCRPN